MTISRIIMDWNVTASMDGHTLKTFKKGEVYDSRIPADCPKSAKGIQHSITHTLIAHFINKGCAHEQTWDEWASDKPMFKADRDIESRLREANMAEAKTQGMI